MLRLLLDLQRHILRQYRGERHWHIVLHLRDGCCCLLEQDRRGAHLKWLGGGHWRGLDVRDGLYEAPAAPGDGQRERTHALLWHRHRRLRRQLER